MAELAWSVEDPAIRAGAMVWLPTWGWCEAAHDAGAETGPAFVLRQGGPAQLHCLADGARHPVQAHLRDGRGQTFAEALAAGDREAKAFLEPPTKKAAPKKVKRG